jgi:D-serine deaminase-like pyridoxal phosphate-dependent protein
MRSLAEARAGTPALSTPALVVDLDVFDANVAAMARLLEGTGKTVRPHVKTHRTPELARRQLGGPAVGLTCATVGEAESMLAAGLDDLLIANEVVDEAKLARVATMARNACVTVAVDAPGPVESLSRRAVASGVTVGVLIDVDILLHRCGVGSVEEAKALAGVVERLPGVELRGIMGYEGRVRLSEPDREGQMRRAYEALATTARALREAGLRVDTVSAAGTSTLREAIVDPVITEIQAGVYALMEPELLVMDLPFRCAVSLRGTVISRHPGRIVLDTGRRVVGIEYGAPVPIGFEAHSIVMGDEHCTITMDDPMPELGSEVALVPGQVRTTFNLHDHVWVTRGEEIVGCWPISARGSSQ